MNVDEVKMVLGILKMGYPAFYKDLKREEAESLINLWAMMFEKENAKIVTEAVKALMCTLKFPPTIADVKEKVTLLTKPDTMTEMEAWGMVLVGIQDSNYHAGDYFEKFPRVIQKIIGNPNQLREWGQMDSETVNSVIQSNFMRSYTAKVRREKEYSMLPDSAKEIKQLVEGLSNKLMIE